MVAERYRVRRYEPSISLSRQQRRFEVDTEGSFFGVAVLSREKPQVECPYAPEC